MNLLLFHLGGSMSGVVTVSRCLTTGFCWKGRWYVYVGMDPRGTACAWYREARRNGR